jgi:hypothetical protein
MRLRARDQIHISSVQADSIRPGQEFEVSDAAGNELLKAHPARLERVGAPAANAEPAPKNKAETKPANKTAG